MLVSTWFTCYFYSWQINLNQSLTCIVSILLEPPNPSDVVYFRPLPNWKIPLIFPDRTDHTLRQRLHVLWKPEQLLQLGLQPLDLGFLLSKSCSCGLQCKNTAFEYAAKQFSWYIFWIHSKSIFLGYIVKLALEKANVSYFTAGLLDW